VLDAKEIDLHEILTDCEFMLPSLLGSEVQLTFQHKAARSWIRADAGQLEQVIANLAMNARDAMPGGGSLTISTRNAFSLPGGISSNGQVAANPGWVVLDMEDTGCGMSEETVSHIFEPFFTTKPVGKGTGLGLPTVYGIVNQFGGQICVDSRPGEGTCFHIYFPVQVPQATIQASTPQPSPVADTSKGLTILLVDDEPSLRAAIAENLRGSGHQVLESQGPHDAVEIARTQAGCIDVRLTDLVMPGLRGPELAEQVGAVLPRIHTIYISGYAQSMPDTEVPQGAAFLQKPFRFASLAEQLTLVRRKA